jgi:hypothetical protein
MAITDTTRSRAPRGTKILTQAFFSALADIPEDRRDAVARAAQSAIREELQARRSKKTGKSTRGRPATGGATKADGPRKRAAARRTRVTAEI